MKKEIGPGAAALILAVVVLMLGWLAWKVFFPPSTLPPLPPELRPGAVGGPPSAPPSSSPAPSSSEK